MMNDFKKQIVELENSLNYEFKNIDLIKEALSHPSLKQHDNKVADYERLELLGDSILGFLITEMIFNNFTFYEEGSIAKIKAYVVSRETIVKVAETLRLSEYILMTAGEEKSGGKTNQNNIENGMEALLAAIYLDSDISQVRKIVQKLWFKYIENVDFSVIDPKSFLQEWAHQKNHVTPSYEVVNREGPVHAPVFTVQVAVNQHKEMASGKSIKEAEKEAARRLLNRLKSNA